MAPPPWIQYPRKNPAHTRRQRLTVPFFPRSEIPHPPPDPAILVALRAPHTKAHSPLPEKPAAAHFIFSLQAWAILRPPPSAPGSASCSRERSISSLWESYRERGEVVDSCEFSCHPTGLPIYWAEQSGEGEFLG